MTTHPVKRRVAGSQRTGAAPGGDTRHPTRGRTWVCAACVFLAGQAHAADAITKAVAVESATLRPADAPVIEAGPGVYLPRPLATSTAGELAACRAAAVQPPAVTTNPTATAVLIGVGVGFLLGVGASIAVAVALR